MSKDQIPTFTVAEVRRFQDGKWGMPPAEVLLAQRLQEQDPMSRLGTSAAEASKALQDLQEASKDLVDLEIVIPEDCRTPEQRAALDAMPKGPSFHRIQRPGPLWVVEGATPTSAEPDIDQALHDLFREPWYKRLWSWLRGTK